MFTIKEICEKIKKTAFQDSIPDCLKVFREGVSFPAAGRPFQAFAPLTEKHFCPFFESFFRSLKSDAVLLRFLEVSWDVLMKRLLIGLGASSWRDLKTIILD